jgi:hypothetical protein
VRDLAFRAAIGAPKARRMAGDSSSNLEMAQVEMARARTLVSLVVI